MGSQDNGDAPHARDVVVVGASAGGLEVCSEIFSQLSPNFPASIFLVIWRFTPAAEKFLNLIPTDTGRRISDINTNVIAPNLDKKIIEGIDTLKVQDHRANVSLSASLLRQQSKGTQLILLALEELHHGRS